ncbi:sodium channel protein Nach [Solenopsis invicta]|uniref:sodium channel protein Nach n=1 Tax=Solenopsis invicta TaxID=13686 RepID=UPI00193CC8E3|nr:sodium channel protein Nach [Solenopsis invicta]
MMSNNLQRKRHMVKRIIVDDIEASRGMRRNQFNNTHIKLYNRSNPIANTKKEVTHQLLNEYLENSSINGIKYFSNLLKPSIIEKIFWTVIMICSFVFLTMLLQKFWQRYSNNPTRTIIKSFYVPVFDAPFPAITICPLLPPMAKRRRKVFESLTLPPNMTETRGRFLVRYGPAFSNVDIPGGRDYSKDLKLLLKTNNMTLLNLVQALRPCEDLFETCMWDGTERNCSELFKVSYTFKGICCSFNYLLEECIAIGRDKKHDDLLKTPLFGPHTGLRVILHREFLIEDDDNAVEEDKYIKYSTNSVGLLLFPHHPLEYVTTIAPRHILQAKQELQIAVIPHRKQKLKGYYEENDQGKLVPVCADDDHIKLKYFPSYRYPNCFTSCSIRAVLNACGCVPLYYTPMAKKYSLKLCDWEDFSCLYENANNIRIIENVVRENLTCECLVPCRSISYDLQSLTLPLNGDHDFNPKLYHNLSKAQSVLKVFMKSATFIEMDTIPAADELYLLSSLGGIFNLFLGCSFISVLEIFYYIGLALHAKFKKSK